MKSCPKCQAGIPDEATFCMNCGTRFATPTGVAIPSAGSSRTMWISIGAIIVALAVLAFFINASGLLRAKGSQTEGKLLQAKGTDSTTGLVRATGTPSSGIAKIEGTPPPAKKVMPDDVRAWLLHLEQTEKKRVDLTQDQLGSLMVKMVQVKMGGAMEALKDLTTDDPGARVPAPHEDFMEDIKKIRASWKELDNFFNSLPPPAECVPIRNDYDQALRETGGMMADVLDVVANSSDNPDQAVAKLVKMEGTSTKRIDSAARGADRGVADICDKYDTRKWFDVSADIGGGGMLSKLGGF